MTEEKQWLKDAIRALLQQRQLTNEQLTNYIMQMVETYEAMKKI